MSNADLQAPGATRRLNEGHPVSGPAILVPGSPGALVRAGELLRAGSLVAFPTDTVYGVGAVVWDRAAVSKLFAAKLRPADKPIPVLLADPADLTLVAASSSPAVLCLVRRFWPGPLTLVVPAAAHVPDEVTAGGATVAVRVPDHDLARALIRAAGAPLAATSANLSGNPSPITAEEVVAQLGDRIPLVLDGGPCPGGVPSTLLDLTGPEPVILRAGPLGMEELLAALR